MTAIIVTILTPAIVWLASQAAYLAKKSIPDSVMKTLVVPTLSAVAAWVAGIAIPDSAPFAVTLLAGLASTFLHEFVKNLGRAIAAMWKGNPVARMSDGNDVA